MKALALNFFGWVVNGGWKKLLAAALLAFALKFGYDVYTDYQDLQRERIELVERNAALESARQVNQATIEEQARQRREAEANRQILEIQMREAESRVRELEKLLSDHDLENLAFERPGLIERRINDATIDLFRDIECVTTPGCVRGE